ncbi:MAG: bifunctional transaldolase/phosoglucose isomerase [Chloroflexi bacterium]|nr:bifunctional transaldolase/phosoglucose isomerase [Chloroflexota bacterium]
MRVAIGADHAGFSLKELLRQRLAAAGHTVLDVGAHNETPVDYPPYARAVAEMVIRGEAERGIMLGGSGEGEAIAPNKLPGIRAALCHDTYTARMSREHNDANVLAMGARVIGPELAWEIVQTWLASEFTAVERHAHRLAEIATWERDRRFPLRELARQGQSLWYDNIRRSLLTSGEFLHLVQEGVSGVTSNPTIFEKAITGSTDYEEDIRALVSQGRREEEVFQALALEDIRDAARQLRPVWELSGGRDGYASIELPPALAHDTAGSVAAATRLWRALATENVMIKVPGTPEGVLALEQLTAQGVNVNVTLLFSITTYEAVAEAYIAGLEALARAGKPLEGAASVASFFVSRVDTAVDALLEERLRSAPTAQHRAELERLLGKAAIANARLAYQKFKEVFSGPRWEALAQQGARPQRPLWASTGTKNPRYRDVLYVEELIGPDTVNTVPPATLTAFLDHGYVRLSLEEGVQESRATLDALERLGIDLDSVTARLQEEGARAFAESYDKLLQSIAAKREELLQGARRRQSASLGTLEHAAQQTLAALRREHAVRRIWRFDPSLWKPDDPNHGRIIASRLGWLTVLSEMQEHLHSLTAFVQEVREAGFTHAVLLGMGGSSLAPEVLRTTFGVAPGYLDLAVLDTTDPAAIRSLEASLPLEHTLFIVSSKSGTTTETLAYYRYFFERLRGRVGERAPEHFVAITDPDTPLEQLAREQGFRRVFANPPDIGGRYSALSYFGLAPAALLGMDLAGLLDRADIMAHACMPGVPAADNPGLWLGAIMGTLAKAGRDKVTLLLSPGIRSFGYWAEQLLAESTGKEGTGLVPVEGEAAGPPAVYGNDRLFVYLRLDGDDPRELDDVAVALAEAGHPVVTLRLRDALDLGGEFFRWEFATAVAGSLLGIDPFDEPNVQESKDNTQRVLSSLHDALTTGRLPEPEPSARVNGLTLYGAPGGAPPDQALARFLAQAQPGDYLAIMAYLTPSSEQHAALNALRTRLRDSLRVATTLGFGPRFLHSTGQLHKGGPGAGLYLQITADGAEDMRVPGSPYTFGTLKGAQALGDFLALQHHGRRVLRVHLSGGPQDAIAALDRLADAALADVAARR